jgi:hypothetical protein
LETNVLAHQSNLLAANAIPAFPPGEPRPSRNIRLGGNERLLAIANDPEHEGWHEASLSLVQLWRLRVELRERLATAPIGHPRWGHRPVAPTIANP